MAKRARILVLTDDERDHRHARRLIDSGVLPLRNPWLLGPADLDTMAVSPDLVVALGRSAVLPAARLRERLGLPGPRPADVLPLLDKEILRNRAWAAGLPAVRHLAAPGEAGLCHVDGVAVGGRVVFAAATRHLRPRHDFAAGSGTGGITLTGAEADTMIGAARAAVARLPVPDGAFHVELSDTRPGPILVAAAPHPPPALLRTTTHAATGVDLLAEHLRAGVGQPTFPRRTREAVAGYWRVPAGKAARTRPALPEVHSEVVLADLPEPGRSAPTEVVVRGDHEAVVLTDLIALRERLDETVTPRS
ncbi:MAG TPA: hypothetical protein VHH15_07520 [Actinophytocola sp.]|nr:hypothetical protein [Actinophytocola sp.]